MHTIPLVNDTISAILSHKHKIKWRIWVASIRKSEGTDFLHSTETSGIATNALSIQICNNLQITKCFGPSAIKKLIDEIDEFMLHKFNSSRSKSKWSGVLIYNNLEFYNKKYDDNKIFLEDFISDMLRQHILNSSIISNVVNISSSFVENKENFSKEVLEYVSVKGLVELKNLNIERVIKKQYIEDDAYNKEVLDSVLNENFSTNKIYYQSDCNQLKIPLISIRTINNFNEIINCLPQIKSHEFFGNSEFIFFKTLTYAQSMLEVDELKSLAIPLKFVETCGVSEFSKKIEIRSPNKKINNRIVISFQDVPGSDVDFIKLCRYLKKMGFVILFDRFGCNRITINHLMTVKPDYVSISKSIKQVFDNKNQFHIFNNLKECITIFGSVPVNLYL